MDEFKETGRVESFVSLPEERKLALGIDESVQITGRQYLQNFGNDAREVFGTDFWVDQVLTVPVEHCPGMDIYDHRAGNARNMRMRYPGVDVLCLTDLRYPNEAERVKALGGVVWEVLRPGLESDGHPSEQPLPRHLVDLQIVNDGTPQDLFQRVVEAIV